MGPGESSRSFAEPRLDSCQACQARNSLKEVVKTVRRHLASGLDWRVGGVLLGLLVTLAVAVQGPIGVSTAYVTVDAAALSVVSPSAAEHGGYLASALRSSEWIGVGGIVAGALIAAFLSRSRSQDRMPSLWRARFGPREAFRFGAAFVAGVLLLFGARLAGGCTSGHVISGLSQLALSGAVFAGAVFAAALPTAWLLYRRSP